MNFVRRQEISISCLNKAVKDCDASIESRFCLQVVRNNTDEILSIALVIKVVCKYGCLADVVT